MDPGHYGLQQGWDNDSALEGYGTAHEPDFRVGGTFNERRFLDERYSKEDFYPREAFHHENLNRENYAPPTSTSGLWPQSRKRSYKEEYAINRESRTHDSYHDLDAFNDHDIDAFQEFDRFHEDCSDLDNFSDHRYERPSRLRSRDRDEYTYDDYEYRSGIVHHKREIGRERDYEYGRHSYDSDYERGSREGNWRRHESRDRERDNKCSSREREQSPHRRYERSRSRGRDDHPRSRSPRGSSHGRNHREHSCDGRHERRRDQDEKRERLNYSMAPSATVVVKGLSHKTTEDDLYQILAEWGPLRHIRVIKERSSGISRGFAFIDFPSVGAAQAMMDKIEDVGLFVDERKLFFEYSSKPTGVGGGTFGIENFGRSGHYNNRSITMPSDWMCTICGCVNFARRTSCFQCNEARTDDAPMADISLTNPSSLGKRGQEAGPTHVLVVRGLDENADEEMLRYEFSKHAPVKDLRLVRDKFTHVSRGFAFIHFHSVEDATKALQATHGTTLEKNGQTLRVAYAKSILGPGSGSSGSSQSSSLAAAAIEAAAFAQQYDAVGWAPKEFNPGDKQSGSGQVQEGKKVAVPNDGLAPQSGFVWDQASGYYYDAASGFYYDGNTGLYYDGNSGVWYTYDHQLQQYIPCTDQCDNTTSGKESESSKALDGSNNRKIVICAPAATVTSVEKVVSLPDVVQAAATAAIAAEKKEKEKAKEIKLASKSSILANKKKMNNVLTLWKQRSHEGQATHIALPDDNQQFASADDRPFTAAGHVTKSKSKMDVLVTRENPWFGSGVTSSVGSESPVRPQPVNNSLGGTLMGIIRGSGSGVAKFNNMNLASGIASNSPAASGAPASSLICDDLSSVVTPFKTNVTALGSQAPLPTASGGGKRRFSEMPQPNNSKEQLQPTTYRDRAAERRSLYGSSSSLGDNLSDIGFGESNREFTIKKGSSDMPFPPGVGGGRPSGDSNISTYEVITADRAIDENNVGNRMLRSMGWQEGLGLGKDGSGMTEPVQAQAVEHRAGLGSQQKLDPNLEVQAGDSYKTLIHKKALARFREMS